MSRRVNRALLAKLEALAARLEAAWERAEEGAREDMPELAPEETRAFVAGHLKAATTHAARDLRALIEEIK
jgi:hypothetical protein